MKATATAHPIQGLIKYHGLSDPILRIPFHDSISVCAGALVTTTTVETDPEIGDDSIVVNGRQMLGRDRERAEIVLGKLRSMAGYSGHLKVMSMNSIREGKGLGFSASGFAALGLSASAALGIDLDEVSLSEAVRLGAGSATRSLSGAFSIWYANKDGKSYAEQIAKGEGLDLLMIIVPIPSSIRTDEAHIEVLSSPLFDARLKRVPDMIESMRKSIAMRDIPAIAGLAEEDSLNLHAITMTGKSHMVLWEPETVGVIKEVIRMREEGIPAWYSIDTGPSVFVNTLKHRAQEVQSRLMEKVSGETILSDVGDGATLGGSPLF